VLAVVSARCALARPTVRELRSRREYDALLSHHAEKTGLPVVVDFYSNSCGPCRMIAPAFKKVAQEYKDRAVFAKVNVEANRETASALRISSMPTFHFYASGKKKSEFSGAGEAQLRQSTAAIVAEAARVNVALPLASLSAYYASVDSGKSAAEVRKIWDKCVAMSGAGGECAGGAARELSKKLKEKFGSAPALGARFGAEQPTKPAAKKTTAAKESTLGSASTEALLAELAKRADEDEAAAAAVEAARGVTDEEEDEDEEEEGLPTYEPRKVWKDYAERVVVLGGGPAGLSAAVYAARAGLSPVVIAPPNGGQLLGKGVTVENFPGVNATGPDLVLKMREHAADVGAAFYPHAATRAHLGASPFVIETSSGANISAHTIIIATGANARWLGVDGEDEFRGGGVSSCATCDGFLFRDRDVAVVGGGDAAMEDALVLARTSRSVTVLHRRDRFRASHALAERVLSHPDIAVRWNTTVRAFRGAAVERETPDAVELVPVLDTLLLDDAATGRPLDPLPVAACFVAIGHDPNTAWLDRQLHTDALGYLELAPGHTTRFATQLSVPGVFAAGDVADKHYRQAITSAGTGAMAALDAERFLSERGLGVEPGATHADDFTADLLQEILLHDTDLDASLNLYDTLDSADLLKRANAPSSSSSSSEL